MNGTSEYWFAFRNALYGEDFDAAETMLRERPSLIEEWDIVGETVLHFLAVEDDLPSVAWLYERGASLDTKNAFGTPVLFDIAELGYTALIEWFVEHGANLHVTDSKGADVVNYLLQRDKAVMADFMIKLVDA